MYNSAHNQKGFTIVELLIVIVIIGILAGIVISILDPVRQQDRARDGVIVATMNKIIADVRAQAASDISGSGYVPDCAALQSSLANDSGWSIANPNQCTFNIDGVRSRTGLVQFRFTRPNATATNFCLSAPANDTSVSPFIEYDPGNVANNGVQTQPSRVTNPCP